MFVEARGPIPPAPAGQYVCRNPRRDPPAPAGQYVCRSPRPDPSCPSGAVLFVEARGPDPPAPAGQYVCRSPRPHPSAPAGQYVCRCPRPDPLPPLERRSSKKLLRSADDVLHASISEEPVECGEVGAKRLVQLLSLQSQLGFELCLHFPLLTRRGEVRARQAARQICELANQLGRPSRCILAGAGQLSLNEVLLYIGELFVQSLSRGLDIARGVANGQKCFRAVELAADDLDLINHIGGRINVVPELDQHRGLRLYVGLAAS